MSYLLNHLVILGLIVAVIGLWPVIIKDFVGHIRGSLISNSVHLPALVGVLFVGACVFVISGWTLNPYPQRVAEPIIIGVSHAENQAHNHQITTASMVPHSAFFGGAANPDLFVQEKNKQWEEVSDVALWDAHSVVTSLRGAGVQVVTDGSGVPDPIGNYYNYRIWAVVLLILGLFPVAGIAKLEISDAVDWVYLWGRGRDSEHDIAPCGGRVP